MLSVFIRDVNAQAVDITQDCKKSAMNLKEQLKISICDRQFKSIQGRMLLSGGNNCGFNAVKLHGR